MENEQLLSGEKKATFQTSDGRKVTIAVPVNTTESGAQVIFNNMIINNEIPNVMSGDSTLDQQDLPFIAKERNAVNLSEQATRNILNPFGAGKTIEAGFRAFADTDFEKNDGRTYGERYRAIKNELTVLDNAYQQLKPVDSAVSDIAGMATSLYAALKGIQTKAPKIYEKITEAKTKFGKTLKNVGLGAGAGIVQGIGEADTIQDIPEKSLQYGLGGGLGVGVFAVGGKAFKIVKNAFTGITGTGNSQQQALNIIKNYIGNDGTKAISINGMKSMLDEMRAIGVPNPVLADLSEDFLQIVNKSTRFTSDKNAVKLFLDGRSGDIEDVVIKKLLQTSGIKSTKFGVDYIDDLLLRQKTAADLAYPELNKVLIDTKELKNLKNIPAFKKAYEDLRKSELDLKNINMPSYDKFIKGNKVSTELLRKLRTKFGELYESNLGPLKEIGTKPKQTDASNAYLNMSKELDMVMSKNNSQYKAANVNFADSFKLNKAYENGYKSEKLTAEEMDKIISKMNVSEKEAYRVGLITYVREIKDKFSGGNIIKRIFGSDRKRRAMEKGFSSKKSFDEFTKFTGFVEKQQQLTGKILNNSATADRLSPVDVSGGLKSQILDELGLNVGSAVSRTTGVNPLVAKRLNELLLEPDPAKQNALFKLLKQQADALKNKNIKGIPTGLLTSPAYKSLLAAQAPRVILPTLLTLGNESKTNTIKR